MGQGSLDSCKGVNMNKLELIATWLNETVKPEDATKFAFEEPKV